MKQFLFIILLALTMISHGYSQYKIDWDAFKEPDGTLLYARFQPQANIAESNRFSFGSLVIFREISDKSVLNLRNSITYSSREVSSNENAVKILSTTGNIDYSRYLNERRGWFVETKNQIGFLKQFDIDRTIPDLINSIGFGKGRIEEVSTVIQSYRIIQNVEAVANAVALGDEEVFALATLLRELDYLFVQDNRIRTISRMSSYLDHFSKRSIDLYDTDITAQLVDGFFNSRRQPVILGYYRSFNRHSPDQLESLVENLSDDPIGDSHFGQKASVSIERWRDGNRNDRHIDVASIKLDMMKSFGISNTIKINAYSAGHYFFNSQDLNYAYRVGVSAYHTPSARAGWGISLMYKEISERFDHLSFPELNIQASYFFSYDTVLTAWMRHRYSDTSVNENNTINVTLFHYFY